MMHNRAIKQTKNWLEQIVIGLNFCPFAKSVFDQEKIHYQLCTVDSLEPCLQALMLEVERLDKHSEIETTLLIFTDALRDFDDFLEAIEIANDLMTAQGCEGIYQLASFHPDYCFAGSDATDPANYTNRSPYPMLHLIREHSIEQALAHYKDPETIPENNMQLARKMGLEKMQRLLASVRK